ncbi:MAG: serine/threonine-protein phosphatase, partial [Deltaproteobacteria bacterium]|nr:serine/threonine-protein phosphatase [Deltaproteobacteria bacterium]
MAGRSSIVGAAATHVGKVREHNEDAHYFDADAGLFVVCDGMGGHAAGEVASGIAIQTIRATWSSDEVLDAIDQWTAKGTPEAKKAMLAAIRKGALAAHTAILAEAAADDEKSGMGTTLVGAMVVGNELVFAHAGDSRAYIVRDNIAMQLTEDHTLLSRLLAAGIDVDLSGEGSRFRSMLTNALGIGQECKIAMFVVPLADGDRFLLASDGITEYVPEPEVGTVLTSSPSPARAAQKLIELALERGGGDNATALVIRVLEAGETPQPVELRRKDDAAIQSCALWDKVSPQQRLRALRIAISRDVGANERLPAHTLGERVAWIIVEGVLEHHGKSLGPGSFIYPESLIQGSVAPDRDSLAITRSDLRGLVLRADDFHELCDDDAELAELLHERLGTLIVAAPGRRTGVITHSEASAEEIGRLSMLDPDRPQQLRTRAETSELADPPPPITPPLPITLPDDDIIPLTNVKAPADAAPAVKPVARTVTPMRGVAVTPMMPVTAVTPMRGVAVTPMMPVNAVTPMRGVAVTPMMPVKPMPPVKAATTATTPTTTTTLPMPAVKATTTTLPMPAVKPPPIPIPKLVKPSSTAGVVAPPIAASKPVPAKAEPSDVVDLGSELRADLGGDHSIPKRRISAPRMESRASTPPPPPVDDEPEIERVVELEAEPPSLAPPLADERDDDMEMTVEMAPLEP